MSVLTRLFLVYVVVVLMIVALGIGVFSYVRGSMEDTLYQNLTETSSRMSQQLDSVIRPMEYTSLHLLSNHRFLSAMEDLAIIRPDSGTNLVLINQAHKEIYSLMMSYSLYKYFHRVSVFNDNHEYFSSNYQTAIRPEGHRDVIEGLPYLEQLQKTDGSIVVLPPFDDPWASGEPRRVFAVARMIRGDPNLGYIEVQQPYSDIRDILSVGEVGGASVCAVTRESRVLHDGGFSGERLDYYRELAAAPDMFSHGGLPSRQNPVTGRAEVFAVARSDYTGVTVLLIQDQQLLVEPLSLLGRQVFALYAAIVLVSCLFFYLQSRSLAVPLRQLKREMEVTHLENLPENGQIITSNNEIISLSHAFNDLKERLNELIQRELTLQSLHMQASFDALQAQVNPHFLYNTLGLISNRAAIQGDDRTLRICMSLASMLRYSVNTQNRQATLGHELAHLEDYIFLMKERYEHNLDVATEVEGGILTAPLPKMVLQPLVENSIHHGYADREGIMRIRLAGRREGERWRLELTDNGRGFSEQSLGDIREKLEDFHRDPELFNRSGGKLGGLGILNIYARMQLLYREAALFYMENIPGGGARVVLGGPLKAPGEGTE